jgi:outer membrane cobalamin receptor
MAPADSSDAAPKEEVVKLEAVSVTGSNISRMDVEKALPVQMMNTDAINSVQAMEPINLILSLPEVTGVPSTEASTGGAGQRGDISTVNMRGLGPAFTLLLVDGYRLVPHPIITTDNFSPNANQFPNYGIDHVDVLRDGASSIYGTDAVAGVINYVMKRDRNDDEIRLRYGLPEHGGGNTIDATIATGRELPGGDGHFTVTTATPSSRPSGAFRRTAIIPRWRPRRSMWRRAPTTAWAPIRPGRSSTSGAAGWARGTARASLPLAPRRNTSTRWGVRRPCRPSRRRRPAR